MACIYYNNNSNSCGGCTKFVKSISLEYEPEVLIITIPAMKIKNHEKICLCITQSIPEEITADTTVVFYIGDSTVKYTGITKLGNFLYADALRSRKLYPLYFATDSKALVLQDLCKLNGTDHQFPIEPPAEEKPK